MNGINGQGGAPSLWSEARNPEGRVYYYNTVTKATQWTKPEEMMTAAEVRFGVIKTRRIPADQFIVARIIESALEGIYRRGWTKVLVQYRVEAKFMGDARSVQSCTCERVTCCCSSCAV